MFQGEYFDGETSRPQPATVYLRDDGLTIQVGSGASADWAFEDIERLEGPAEAGLRLAADGHPDARFVMRDAVAIEALLETCPALKRAGASRRGRRRAFKWVAGGLVVLALIGVAAFEGAPRLAAYTPMRWVAPIGENVRAQAAGLFGAEECTSDGLQRSIDTLARRLLANVEPSTRFDPAALDVIVVDSEIPNAFAAPGGKLMMFAGILDLAGKDHAAGGDMFAAVLAHEIAHARLRHPTRALGRSLGLQILAQLGGAGYGADAGLMLAQMAYGREAEREADTLARAMLKDAGIGDAGLAAFFEAVRTRFSGGGDEASFLSTHPPLAERAAIRGVDGDQDAFTPDQWNGLRALCIGES